MGSRGPQGSEEDIFRNGHGGGERTDDSLYVLRKSSSARVRDCLAASTRDCRSAVTCRSNAGPIGIGSPPTIVARTADSVSRSACSPRRPRSGPGTAAVIATTFPSSSPEPITQSMAFFTTPGRLKPYSGEAMRTASLPASACLQRSTLSGTDSASMSGLKCGKSRSPSNRTSSTPVGIEVDAADRSARFFDFAWRLPQIARILMWFDIYILQPDAVDIARET